MGVAELWATLEHAIRTYTGLSPATFFTSVAIAFAFYYAVSSFFEPAPVPRKREVEVEPVEPLPPPVQLGEIDAEELLAFDGSDPKKPLLMAIKGQIYDVTQSRMFYGPGGPYALFAGKDASRALAKMSFEQKDLTGDISGLGPFELEALQDWEYKFMSKYVKVGTIKKTILVTDDPSDSANSSGITTDAGNQTTEVTSRTVDSGETSHTPDPPTSDDDAKVVDHKTDAETVAALKHDEAKEVDQTAEEVQKKPKHDEAKEVDQTAEEVQKED